MNEHGMLYSEPMVIALLDGSKTQTRRMMKPQPHEFWSPAGYGELHAFDKNGDLNPDNVIGWGVVNEDGDQGYPCPYGQPGHRIWVRETFLAYGRWETRFSAKKARDEWHFVDMTLECDRRYQYAADNPDVPLAKGRGGALPGWYTRPAIFMPRAASRILLEIVSIRVERLHDLSEVDAIAEGIEQMPCEVPNTRLWRNYRPENGWTPRVCIPQNSFHSLWEVINGEDSWLSNPWCWAVEFKRVTQ
jgi:hypothetical protein